MEPSQDPISIRCSKLNQLFLGKNAAFTHKTLVGREGLLDALFTLYNECNSEYMMRNKFVAAFVKKCNITINELRSLRVNISDFEMKSVIGRGHYGEVQVVREKQTGDVYAMKIMRKSETLSQQNTAFFEEERDIMAKANNHWITTLQYAFQDKQNLYLVMEFHPGGDLLSLLERFDDVLEESMAKFYLAEITLAIHTLHSMGYAHRDIKPDNILVDRTGHIKLADFGSAAKLTASKMVSSKMPVGTPEYIAPEVLTAMNGGDSMYGASCDWWSLGIVAYEMLAGKTPFSDDRVSVTYSKIMNFKNSLQFPDIKLSNEAMDLIRGLLTESNKRYGYEALCKHRFFSDIDWTNLRQTIPPYVPTVNGLDDTSNFEDFEHETHFPSLEDLKEKREFSGRDLPFVGFTYTSNLNTYSTEQEHNKSSLSSSFMNANLEQRLEQKNKELGEVLQRCNYLDNQLTLAQMQFDNMHIKFKEKVEVIKTLDEERNSLEIKNSQLYVEVTSLKRQLDLERTERISTENKAFQLLEDIKQKYKKAEGLRVEELRIELNDQKFMITQLEQERLVASQQVQKLQSDYQTILQECEELRNKNTILNGKLSKVMEDKRLSVVDITSQLQRLNEGNQKMNEEFRQKSEQAKLEFLQEIDRLEMDKERLEQELEAKSQINEDIKQIQIQSKANLQQLEMKLKKEMETLVQNKDKQIMELKTELKNLTLDKDNRIATLIEELSQSSTEKTILEKEVTECRHLLTKQCDETESKKTDEYQALNKKKIYFESKVTHLLSELDNLKLSLYSEKSRVQELENQLKQKKVVESKEMTSSSTEKKVLEVQNIKLKEEIACLKDNLDKTRDHMRKTEIEVKVNTGISAEKKNLEDQNGKLKEEIIQLKSDLSKSKQQIKSMESEMEKILRENKNTLETIEVLNMQQKEFKKQCRDKELLEDQILKLKNELTCLKDSFAKSNQHSKVLESKLDKLQSENKKAYDTIENLNQQIKSLSNECSNKQELKDFEEQNSKMKDEVAALKEDLLKNKKLVKALESEREKFQRENKKSCDTVNELNQQLQNLKQQFANQELTISTLKTTCTTLEEQIQDFEALNEHLETKYNKIAEEKKLTESEQQKLNADIQAVQKKTLAEKMMRESAENKVKTLDVQLTASKELHQSEVQTLQQHNSEQRNNITLLNQQLDEMEKKIGNWEITHKTLQRKYTELDDDYLQLQEERSKLSNQLNSLKSSNFKLTQGLEEAVEKGEILKTQKEGLENIIENMQVEQQHDRFKLEATISQQTKLIDFLQAKTEQMGKKKKGLSLTPVKMFVRQKENIAGSAVPLQWKELQQQLKHEKEINQELRDLLNKTRSELVAVKQESIRAKSRSKDFQLISDLSATMTSGGSSERINHDIPHRLSTIPNMRASKCPICLDTIHLGRRAVKCQDCGIISHHKCGNLLPKTCGLSPEMAELFAIQRSISKECTENISNIDRGHLQGWLKIPRTGRQGWDKKWMTLSGSQLCIFDSDLSKEPVSTYEMCAPDCEVIIHSAVSAGDINTAPSDLPFILRLELSSHTTCWPSRSLYLMAPTFSDKQNWVQALEATASATSQHKVKHWLDNSLLDLPDGVDLNCILHLSDEVVLLGAEEGFYYSQLQKRNLNKIPGIGRILQLKLIKEMDIILMITGANQQLGVISKSSIMRLLSTPNSQPNIKLVDDVTSCHLFSCEVIDGIPHICVAMTDKIMVLKYCDKSNMFQLRKEFDTVEPCSCILFTESTLIIGADKFYSIELDHFTTEEFLDSSDTSLAFTIFGASQSKTFPVAIFKVSAVGLENEYLLCFHEFGVFVNGFGRRSREDDLRWTRLPLVFAFREPFLFVIHHNSIEIHDISQSNQRHIFLPVCRPHYLGPSILSGSIYLATVKAVHQICGMKIFLTRESSELSLKQIRSSSNLCNTRQVVMTTKIEVNKPATKKPRLCE